MSTFSGQYSLDLYLNLDDLPDHLRGPRLEQAKKDARRAMPAYWSKSSIEMDHEGNVVSTTILAKELGPISENDLVDRFEEIEKESDDVDGIEWKWLRFADQ